MISPQYAAGFFDGEGCINITQCRGTPVVRILIVNTNLQVLEMFKETWGGSIHKNKKGKEYWKQAYTWKLSYISAKKFLEDIYPFLVIKQLQAEAAFLFFSVSPGKGKKRDEEATRITTEAIDKIKTLNKKGINEVI